METETDTATLSMGANCFEMLRQAAAKDQGDTGRKWKWGEKARIRRVGMTMRPRKRTRMM